jgi:hypothetical protein
LGQAQTESFQQYENMILSISKLFGGSSKGKAKPPQNAADAQQQIENLLKGFQG